MVDVPPWIGWEKLLSYYDKCPKQLHKDVFTILFETGGRVSEIIELRPEQFVWNDEAITIAGMTVLKYRRRMRRDVYIKRDEHDVLAEDLVSFVERCKTDYLFPRTTPFYGEPIAGEHTSRVRIYLLTREISDDLWPHFFRSQRASYLVYVRGLNAFELKDWFGWKSMDSAGHYVRQTGKAMAKALGIETLPGRPEVMTKPILEPKSSPLPKTEPKKEKSTYELLMEVTERG